MIQNSDNSYKKYIPILTLFMGLVSLFLFIGINLEPNLENWSSYKKWGAPSLTDMFNGDYWGLITTNFVHVEIWHIGFNLYWLWILGKRIEFGTNKPFYALLIFSAACVSSFAQIGFAGTSGIGLSGIVYALFGYLYVKNRISPEYKGVLDKMTIILFMVWLVLCLILTELNIWIVGNAAHFGGLFWGMLLGYLSNYVTYKQWIIGSVIFLIIGTAFLWNPFSTAWLSHNAYVQHAKENFLAAEILYQKILERDDDNEWAKENLLLLEVQELSEKAYKLSVDQKFEAARQVSMEILDLDPDHEWARQNIFMLDIQMLSEKAFALQTQQKFKEAQEVYMEILTLDPENEWAKQNLGILLMNP